MKKLDDVRLFFYTLSNMRWHPDDNFHFYTTSSGEKMFSPEEAQNLNRLMAESFALCSELGADIYSLACDYQMISPEQIRKGDIAFYDYNVFSWQ